MNVKWRRFYENFLRLSSLNFSFKLVSVPRLKVAQLWEPPIVCVQENSVWILLFLFMLNVEQFNVSHPLISKSNRPSQGNIQGLKLSILCGRFPPTLLPLSFALFIQSISFMWGIVQKYFSVHFIFGVNVNWLVLLDNILFILWI